MVIMLNTKSGLITELNLDKKMTYYNYVNEKIDVIRTVIDEKESKKYKSQVGLYYTVFADYLKEMEVLDKLNLVILNIFKKCLSYYNIKKTDIKKILIVGIGNSDIKSDSLGPSVVDKILVNNHLKNTKYKVSAIIPGVTGKTGIETFYLVDSINKNLKYDLVIIIDSLFSKSVFKINKTIQISTSGIVPGSGVGSNLLEISSNSLNTPVISIGIPTVVDFYSLAKEFIELNNMGENERFYKYLNNKKNNMIVSSKDINEEMEVMSFIISRAINNFFHLYKK